MAFELTYKPFGERSILIEWPSIIDEKILKDMVVFETKIKKNDIKSIVEVKIAYNSLLIIYDSICRNYKKEIDTLKALYVSSGLKVENVSRLWTVPVCYDSYFGIDLETISAEKKCSEVDVIKRHSQAVYTVYFIGFLPGFLYLGGLNEALFVPRKSTPRLKIQKGSVAIGGKQTGVYPCESPGGWQVIGNSPIAFFDATKEVPCFAKPGDRIVFKPITLQEHQSVKVLVDAGVYQMESEVVCD